jgi:hypothetical protein
MTSMEKGEDHNKSYACKLQFRSLELNKYKNLPGHNVLVAELGRFQGEGVMRLVLSVGYSESQ